MTLEDRFNDAQRRIKTLTAAPSNEMLLELYSLYKQGTQGDVQGKRPGMLDIKGRAKYDAWAKLSGTARQQAMEKYVALVERLVS